MSRPDSDQDVAQVAYTICPTSIVHAPVEVVWKLVTLPDEWGDFFDTRIRSVEPPGQAQAGQMVFAESGPRLLRLALEFRFTKVDIANHELQIDVQLPFGITVRENLSCIPLGPAQCRVSFHCGFSFPAGWRGAVTRLLLLHEINIGPVDSLSRLRRAAEQLYAANAAR
jgi:hypothetical protein